MTDVDLIRDHIRAANPIPHVDDVDVDEFAAFVKASEAKRLAFLHAPTPHSAKPQPVARGRRPAAWVFAAALVAVLVAIGIPVWLGGGEDPGTSTEPDVATTITTPPTTVQPTPTAPAEVVPFPPSELAVLEVPLSEAVPGFSDTIVWTAVVESSGNVFEVVFLLRSSESIPELLLSPEDGFGGALDASANWVAHDSTSGRVSVDAVPTGPGEPSRREIFGHDARDGVVWHDTEPGHLAWLECASPLDGPTTLFTLDVSDPSADPIRVRSFDQGCRSWGLDEPSVTLVRWGSTGVWVTKYPGDWEARWFGDTERQDGIESVLVDADGAEIATVSDALMIGMSPDGTSVWQSGDWEGQYFVLSPDGQQRSTVPGLDGEHLGGAWWSPDGTRLAMWVNAGLRTVDFVSGEVITEIGLDGLDAYRASLAWSTDSRFLVYEELPFPQDPDKTLLVIHDTATNTTTKIPHSGDVGDIRVR